MFYSGGKAQLHALREEQERIVQRIEELEKILSDNTAGIVKLNQAKVELAGLRQRHLSSQLSEARAETDFLRFSRYDKAVTKNRELTEQRIRRNEKRAQREEEIKRIQRQLQNESALKTAEHREKLEVALKAAQDAIEVLDIENANEVSEALIKGSSVAVKESYSRHPTSRTPSIPESLLEPAAVPSAAEEQSGIAFNVEVKEHGSEHADVEAPEATHMAASAAAEALGIGVDVAKEENKKSIQEVPEAAAEPEVHMRISFAPGTNSETAESKGTRQKRRTSSFYLRQIALLQQEAAEREFAMEKLNALMKEEEKENQEKIGALESRIQSLATEAGDQEKLLNHWQVKGKALLSECLSLEGDVDQRKKSLEELEDFKRMQEERIASLELEQQECALPPPRPSMKGGRRFSARASINPSFRIGLQRASRSGSIDAQMREEAKLEMMALEELLAMMDGEKGELLAELEAMKEILAATEENSGKKKTERLVYQLSCKKCNKHGSFVGTTDVSLKSALDKHFNRVVEEAKKKKGKKENTNGGDKVKKGEAWHEEFAQHFAKHTKKRFGKVSEKDIIKFCQRNVKIEVLRRGDGAALMWEEDE